MRGKLVLCYELALDQLDASIDFFKNTLKPNELVCLKPSELESFSDEPDSLYTFHLDLKKELETHSYISAWAKKKQIKELNPFYYQANIFDDKYLFAKFCIVSGIGHPKTKLINSIKEIEDESGVIKPRFGTENKDNASYSPELLEKILSYDDALFQEEIKTVVEYKVLFLIDKFYFDKSIPGSLEKELLIFKEKLDHYLSQKKLSKVEIFSIDILEDQNGHYYFLELNLRPGALYRFQYK